MAIFRIDQQDVCLVAEKGIVRRSMLIDGLVILGYFIAIMAVGIASMAKKDANVEDYFMSNRTLRWPTIAMSTIATNISAGNFLAMAGSAYLYGLAHANLEINAIIGILMAVFVFLPYYLKRKAITITQFFEDRFGSGVALSYSSLMIILYSFVYLGNTLFWASYAIEGVFGSALSLLGATQAARLWWICVILGTFSAAYTMLGGLTAVVRTDRIQFVILLTGGVLTLGVAIHALGGVSELWNKTGHLMHLHLPADHETLPWTGLYGMTLIHIYYWAGNQIILQRAMAAKDLKHAQLGLLAGGVIKYATALIVIVPGVALAGIHQGDSLSDPDKAYLSLIVDYLPAGVRGVILCGLFASLMSSADSIFNSVSTMWSVDIYRKHLRPNASDQHVVRSGKIALGVALFTGLSFAALMIYMKTGNPGFPLTHWFKSVGSYIMNGFALLLFVAAFLIKPNRHLVLFIFLSAVLATFALDVFVPSLNYFVRSGWVVSVGFVAVAVPTILKNGWRISAEEFFESAGPQINRYGVALLTSLILLHIIFH